MKIVRHRRGNFLDSFRSFPFGYVREFRYRPHKSNLLPPTSFHSIFFHRIRVNITTVILKIPHTKSGALRTRDRRRASYQNYTQTGLSVYFTRKKKKTARRAPPKKPVSPSKIDQIRLVFFYLFIFKRRSHLNMKRYVSISFFFFYSEHKFSTKCLDKSSSNHQKKKKWVKFDLKTSISIGKMTKASFDEYLNEIQNFISSSARFLSTVDFD